MRSPLEYRDDVDKYLQQTKKCGYFGKGQAWNYNTFQILKGFTCVSPIMGLNTSQFWIGVNGLTSTL